MSFEGGGIPETEVARLQKVDTLDVMPTINAGLPTYIQWDLTKEPFSDARFRQAVLYAIDRQAIVDTIMLGLPKVSNTQFPQDWAVPADLNSYAYDPEKAKALLGEMGWQSSWPDRLHLLLQR